MCYANNSLPPSLSLLQETLVDSLPLLPAGEMGSVRKGKVEVLTKLPLSITTMRRKVLKYIHTCIYIYIHINILKA